MDLLQSHLNSLVHLVMLLFEYIGVVVIAIAGVRGIIHYIQRDSETRLLLAKGLAMGLEFKPGARS